MKKLLILQILCLTLFSKISISQSSDIDLKNLTESKWKINEAKEIYFTKVIRREGENSKYAVTNIAYQSYDQLLVVDTKKANTQMWSDEKKKDNLEILNTFAKGGKITLYVKRLTIEAANLKHYTVVIKDIDEKELYREVLKERIANVPTGSELWYNIGSIMINVEFTGTFYVYIIDDLSNDTPRYKFEVIN